MRTETYGAERFYLFIKKYPKIGRSLTTITLIFECAFPLAYFFKGRLVKPFLATGVAFHGVNALLMGLGRFLIAFPAMYPAFAYTAIPTENSLGKRRDDAILPVLGLGLLTVSGVAGLSWVNRRMVSQEGWPHSKYIMTRHGNKYTYEWGGDLSDKSEPVYLFTPALAATAEHYAWITESLAHNHDKRVVMASRPGYGASHRLSDQPFSLKESIDDLEDLVASVTEDEQKVILIGHSWGGELMRRLALRLGENKVKAVIYLDPTHPAELVRSESQREGAEKLSDGLNRMVTWLNLGTGFLLRKPPWITEFPENYREKQMAHYGDSRMWRAASREWDAAYKELLNYTEPTEIPDTPALLIAAGETVHNHPEQLSMYKEIVPGFNDPSDSTMQLRIIAAADHDSLLSDSKVAEQVVMALLDYVEKMDGERTN